MNQMRITKMAALTMNNIFKWCVVGGKDADDINPVMFDKSWTRQDKDKHQEWCDAIRKEINNMTKREVWHKAQKDQILKNFRLIGSKWVFKKKGNFVYRTHLCGLGYVQVPGLDYTENFSPVVLEVTFCIVFILMIKYGWISEIVDADGKLELV